ncbi:uncharacterized protein LOC127750901 [Frankliniella occidentalis]|uniref:Uncharacterized protein LOC127750901 n=1 Tax=Frankliniella occidentalis TaxID=133901 RepID=A0A9C6XSE7_FRAOC|nr:uncharacterized protein LOC127750901 [Frankliniella occidentalis]
MGSGLTTPSSTVGRRCWGIGTLRTSPASPSGRSGRRPMRTLAVHRLHRLRDVKPNGSATARSCGRATEGHVRQTRSNEGQRFWISFIETSCDPELFDLEEQQYEGACEWWEAIKRGSEEKKEEEVEQYWEEPIDYSFDLFYNNDDNQ